MLYAIVAVLALLLDQAVKYYVTLQIDLNTGVQPLIPKVVSLMNIHNTGAAFSMFSGGGARWLFVILAVAITVAVVSATENLTPMQPAPGRKSQRSSGTLTRTTSSNPTSAVHQPPGIKKPQLSSPESCGSFAND